MDIQGSDGTPTLAIIILLLLFLDFIFSGLIALFKLWRLWKRKGQKKRSEPECEPNEWQTHAGQVYKIIRQDKTRVSGLLFVIYQYECVDDERTYGATLVHLAGLSIQLDGGDIKLDGWVNMEVDDLEAQKMMTFFTEFYRDYYWQFCKQQNTDVYRPVTMSGGDVRAILQPRRLAICAGPVAMDASASDVVTTAPEGAATVNDADETVTDGDSDVAATDAAMDATITDNVTATTATSDATTYTTAAGANDDTVATTVTPSASTDASTTTSSSASNTPLHILLGCDKSPYVPYLWATGLAVCLITRLVRI